MRKVVLIAITLFGLLMGAVVMSQPPFPEEPPWYIEIAGLDNFALTGPTPGIYTGSDNFTVGVNWPAGATVSSSITAFTPALTNTASANVAPTDVAQGITSCTVSASVDVILLDAPGTRQATLTITVTNKPM